MPTKQEATLALAARLGRYGITPADMAALLRCERTLHRWADQECGDGNNYASWCVVRDEDTGKTYREVHPHTGPSYREPIRDRETAAQRSVERILSRYPGLIPVYQGDPRGCALTIVRTADIPEGTDPYNYGSYGVAVCV